MNYPWKKGVLADWDIVGMNHYYEKGVRRLFVAMVRDGRCIKVEGPDEELVWQNLAYKATQ